MSDRLKRITELRREIAELEAAEKAEKDLPIDHKIATALHSLFCHWNHTDGCGWFYEVEWDANRKWGRGSTHESYLKWADRLIHSSPLAPELIYDVIGAISLSKNSK